MFRFKSYPFFFIRLLFLFVGVVSACSFSLADLAKEKRDQLKLIQQESHHKILFLDVDETLGQYNEATKTWTLYEGADHFIQKAAENFSVVLFTGNTVPNIELLLNQYPQIKPHLKLVITSEFYAPGYAKMVKVIEPLYAKLNHPCSSLTF